MKFVRFTPSRQDTEPRVGILQEERIIDVAELLKGRSHRWKGSIVDIINAGPSFWESIRNELSDYDAGKCVFARDARLWAPIARPGKILCSGINYHGHFRENPTAKMPDEPFFFAKMPSTIIGPETPIVIPRRSQAVDYEVEFSVVIGRTLKRAEESEVKDSLFGYTIVNDVSARDVQFKDNQITLGKNFDTFTPLGPCIVTCDEIPDPAAVGLRTRVNGQLRQDSSTGDWVFSLPRLIASLSEVMTLEPGDIVTTGTPAGVGLFRKPPTYLQPGDRVELEIDGIGVLGNPVEGL